MLIVKSTFRLNGMRAERFCVVFPETFHLDFEWGFFRKDNHREERDERIASGGILDRLVRYLPKYQVSALALRIDVHDVDGRSHTLRFRSLSPYLTLESGTVRQESVRTGDGGAIRAKSREVDWHFEAPV
jgi:hypothetical protein